MLKYLRAKISQASSLRLDEKKDEKNIKKVVVGKNAHFCISESLKGPQGKWLGAFESLKNSEQTDKYGSDFT